MVHIALITIILTSFIHNFHFVFVLNMNKGKDLFVSNEHDGIQYNTGLFQMNVMRFNTIYGTH